MTLISPGVVESELAESISDGETKRRIEEYGANALPAEAMARTILCAIEQPENVDVSDMIVAPTGRR